MTRPTFAVALVATAMFLVAACGGTPTASALTDPTAILEAAAAQAAEATAVHVGATADGALNLDLMGTGSATPLQLTGSTANADVDITGGDARVTFSLPGVLGLRGELIAVDGTAYLKTSLTGPNYRTIATGGAPADPSASPDTASMLANLTTFLARPELAPTKGEDVDCGGTTCYTVTIELTPEELAALTAEGGAFSLPSDLPIDLPDMSGTTVDLTVRVEKDTTRLSGLTAVIGTGTPAASGTTTAGDMTVELTFTKWNEAVSVSAPPADQVDPAG